MVKPTILFAIDSAETRLLEKYATAGQLPFLGKFVKNWRIVEGPHHFCEMGAWTTFWSGIPAVQHGYHCIRRLVPGEYAVKLSHRPIQECPPFWATMPGSVSIWDAQECDPDPRLKGEQLCNWRTSFAERCPPTPASYPENLLEEVVARHGEPSRPEAINLQDTAKRRRDLFLLSKQRIATSGRLFREAMERGARDLYVFGCAELHSAGHLCWTYDEEGDQRMLELYQDLDRELESVYRLAPEGSRFLAVSAYGIYANYPASDVAEQILRGLGYQQAPPGGGLSLKSLLPLGVRRKIGEYLPMETQERLINENLKNNTDWSKSVAFGMPTLYTGYIRINLRGREPEGIVEPGREYEELVDRIADDFAQLKSPVASKIRRVAELSGGVPLHLPDIMVSWQERETPWEEVEHPRYRAPIERHHFHRSTYHSYRGFIGALDEGLLEGIPAVLDIPDVASHLRRICS
jgi:hypothetical protein